jgi:hypothetical protein
MNSWYMSYNRFEKRIIRIWKKEGFKYNDGHIQLLRYSYQTLMFWSVAKYKKISEKNKPVGHPTLF